MGLIASPLRSAPSALILAVVIGFALTALAWLPGPPIRPDQFALPKDAALGATGLLAGGVLLMWGWIRIDSSAAWALLCLLSWFALSGALVAVNAPYAWYEVGRVGAAASVFFAIRAVCHSPRQREALTTWIILIAMLQCVIVLAEAYGAVPFFSEPGRRPGAMLGNRNLSARFVCLTLPLLWRKCVVAVGWREGAVVTIQVALTCATLILSRSRGAWLISLTAVLVLPLATTVLGRRLPPSQRWGATRRWFTGIGAAACVLMAPTRLGWTGADYADSLVRVAELSEGTGRGRVVQFATTARMLTASWPVGVGAGNWSVVYPKFASSGDPSVALRAVYPTQRVPRSDALSLLAELGAPGAILICVFVVLVGRRTRALLADDNADAQLFGVVLAATCTMTVLLGFVEPVIRSTPTLLMLVAVLAIASARSGLRAGDLGRWPPLATVVLAVSIVASVHLTLAATREAAATNLLRHLKSPADLTSALRIAPDNVEVRLTMAFVLTHAGLCEEAREHVTHALAMQPYSGAARDIQRLCDSRQR